MQNSLDTVAVTDAQLSEWQGIYRSGGRFSKKPEMRVSNSDLRTTATVQSQVFERKLLSTLEECLA